MSKQINLSVILPVYNEKDNLEYFVPQIHETVVKLCQKFEILIIDDQSIDGTQNLIKKFKKEYENLSYFVRDAKRSLPMSIFNGVEKSKYENIMWLDADGSMDTIAIKKLILEFKQDTSKYYVGSRFIEGGGYKGQLENQKGFFNLIKNIKNSEDSFLAIYLSILFNKILKFQMSTYVTDLTSGFIIGNKKNIEKEPFEKSNYGEYFLYLISDLISKNKTIIEIGYYCKPRVYGKSKTSNNLMTLIRLGLPYIKAANICKKNLKEMKKF
tara:strand:- start:3212 stop:4018 length:807 start_codon:yes stop_codon:yes gene_type:complete